MNTSKKILIIEDDEDLRFLTSDMLKKEGFEVIEAEDGIIGLSLAQEEHPDLVLLDLEIPGMDGMNVLEKLKEKKETALTPVIIFSNTSEITRIGKAMDQGVFQYLTKSDWKLEGVLQNVKEALKLS